MIGRMASSIALPSDCFRQRRNKESDHDHCTAKAHAKDDVIVETVSNFFRPFDQYCCDEGKQGYDEPYRRTPPC